MKEGLHCREDGSIYYHCHVRSGDRTAVKPFIDSMGDGRPVKHGVRRFDLVKLEVLEPESHQDDSPDHPVDERAWNILVRELFVE